MKFSKDFLIEVLEKRESINILSEGVISTIKSVEFISDSDVDAIDEIFETFDYAIEERVQIKRKYGEHSPYQINKGASIRNPIVEFVGTRFVTDKELSDFLLRLEEDRGNSINQKRWFGKNQKYFESFQNRGQQVWTLSKFGKRVFEFVIKERNKKQLNESIGLFKFNTLNEADKMSMSYRLTKKDEHNVDIMWSTLSKDKMKSRSEIIDEISNKLGINWFEISAWIKRNYRA
jgi:hypothetical protein